MNDAHSIQSPIKHAFQSVSAVIDEIGMENAATFLAKLALVLADKIADPEAFEDAIRRAKVEA